MSKEVTADENRRQAVRVTDRILLSSHRIETDKFDALAKKIQQGISFYNQDEIGEIGLYLGAQSALGRVREKDEDLAEFLQHLDHKLNRIMDSVSDKPSPLSRLESQEVNISGGGLAFFAKEELAMDDQVELHVVLMPEYTHIYAIARVVSCEKQAGVNSSKPFRIACEFSLIMDEDRETIIQHIFKRQQLALRKRREEEDKTEK